MQYLSYNKKMYLNHMCKPGFYEINEITKYVQTASPKNLSNGKHPWYVVQILSPPHEDNTHGEIFSKYCKIKLESDCIY